VTAVLTARNGILEVRLNAFFIVNYVTAIADSLSQPVPRDAVEVIAQDLADGVNYPASAATGYIPDNYNALIGRHAMWINANLPQEYSYRGRAAIIVHEIGHIMGLAHEHQRQDRDHYVYFNCSNVDGYEATKRQVDATRQYTMEEVCTTYKLAVEFSFGATESMTDPHYDYSHPDGYKRP
jgi:hypothetical protein